jgi:hypothetical protein
VSSIQPTPETPLSAVSVGIMAYNEAANIAAAIESALRQRLQHGHIAEVIVVASGCTDDTVPIVADIARREPRLQLIVQERREGKASAINIFLAAARSPLLVMASADIIIKDGTVNVLLGHFQDPTVGMVGAHPVPVNGESTFLAHAVRLVWQVHDQIAREAPKLGEVVAFRNVVPGIPVDTSVDEISIQALVSQLGYRLVYEPRAIVYNRGPATIGDFLRQRRRIYAGHLQIQHRQGYSASTMSVWRIARALLASGAFAETRTAGWTIGAVGLEALARGLGAYDYLQRRQHQAWEMAATTKSHIADEANVQSHQSVLVFHIVAFHQHELELGARTSQMLTHQVTERVREGLIPGSVVSTQRGGTIICLLPVDREEAERAAQHAIETVEATPVRCNGHRDGVPVALACGIIAFLRTGPVALAVGLPTQSVTA